MNDDELYRRAVGIATHAEEIASNAREVIEQARQAIVNLQGKDGPVQGMTANVKQTLDGARAVGRRRHRGVLDKRLIAKGK